jgi:hypothetical protein
MALSKDEVEEAAKPAHTEPEAIKMTSYLTWQPLIADDDDLPGNPRLVKHIFQEKFHNQMFDDTGVVLESDDDLQWLSGIYTTLKAMGEIEAAATVEFFIEQVRKYDEGIMVRIIEEDED